MERDKPRSVLGYAVFMIVSHVFCVLFFACFSIYDRVMQLLPKVQGPFKLMVLEVTAGIAASPPDEDFSLRNLWISYRLSESIKSR